MGNMKIGARSLESISHQNSASTPEVQHTGASARLLGIGATRDGIDVAKDSRKELQDQINQKQKELEELKKELEEAEDRNFLGNIGDWFSGSDQGASGSSTSSTKTDSKWALRWPPW